MEMTIKKVNGVKVTLVNKIENMTADLLDREQYASTTLPSKLRSAQSITINPSTPGAPVQQIKKNLAIKEIQRDMSKTDKAIAALKKGIPLAKTSLEELTKIATFGNRLDGQVMLQFRLFINIGDQELTLVSSKIE